MILADVSSPYRYDRRRWVRQTFRDGKLAAFCGHPREDCPFPGNERCPDGRRRGEKALKIERTKRAAWLDGWEKQTAAMRKKP